MADQLLAFFKTDPLARNWFLRSTQTGQPPTVSISVNGSAGEPPLSVQFTSNVSDVDGTIVEFAWTFGDGGFSLAPNPAKTFPVAGEYPVFLTVTDDDGNTATASRTISVGPPQIPAVSAISALLLAVLLAVGGAVAIARQRITARRNDGRALP